MEKIVCVVVLTAASDHLLMCSMTDVYHRLCRHEISEKAVFGMGRSARHVLLCLPFSGTGILISELQYIVLTVMSKGLP